MSCGTACEQQAPRAPSARFGMTKLFGHAAPASFYILFLSSCFSFLVSISCFYFLRSRSAARKVAKTTEITPFMVKKAAFSLERSLGLTSECS